MGAARIVQPFVGSRAATGGPIIVGERYAPSVRPRAGGSDRIRRRPARGHEQDGPAGHEPGRPPGVGSRPRHYARARPGLLGTQSLARAGRPAPRRPHRLLRPPSRTAAPGVDWSALGVCAAPTTTTAPTTPTGAGASPAASRRTAPDHRQAGGTSRRTGRAGPGDVGDRGHEPPHLPPSNTRRDLENTRNVSFGFIVSVAAGEAYAHLRALQRRQVVREEAAEEATTG